MQFWNYMQGKCFKMTFRNAKFWQCKSLFRKKWNKSKTLCTNMGFEPKQPKIRPNIKTTGESPLPPERWRQQSVTEKEWSSSTQFRQWWRLWLLTSLPPDHRLFPSPLHRPSSPAPLWGDSPPFHSHLRRPSPPSASVSPAKPHPSLPLLRPMWKVGSFVTRFCFLHYPNEKVR